MKKKEFSVEPSLNEDSWFEKASEAKLKKYRYHTYRYQYQYQDDDTYR